MPTLVMGMSPHGMATQASPWHPAQECLCSCDRQECLSSCDRQECLSSYASTASGTSWMALLPDLGNGRGMGWAIPLASMVRQRRR